MNNPMKLVPNPVPKIVAEYKEDFGMDVEVYFHNSRSSNLDLDNFNYRSVSVSNKPASGRGPGIFTHTGDEYFNKFGNRVYAVVVQKGHVIIQMEDDVSNKVEVFIPMNRVEEIIAL
tara:strand:+ start:1045 stop:1395 length:351 start_codon:yes stop_codon:yes gene_type:complete